MPPVGGAIGAVFDLSACEATVFFLISFCMRLASASSAFVGGASSSLEYTEFFRVFILCCCCCFCCCSDCDCDCAAFDVALDAFDLLAVVLVEDFSFSVLTFAFVPSLMPSFLVGDACDDFVSLRTLLRDLFDLFDAELRFPACELDDSVSEDDEFESESLELALDDVDPELLLVPDVLID